MQITWYTRIKLKDYQKDVSNNNFPVIIECPCCGAGIKLYRHGFYYRNYINGKKEYRIKICRYYCRSCKKTLSLLPWFLLPYFQHSRSFILNSLNRYFRKLPSDKSLRQLISFYRGRFVRNMNAIIGSLRQKQILYEIPNNENNKAIELLGYLITPPREATLKGHSDHTLHNFMALSF